MREIGPPGPVTVSEYKRFYRLFAARPAFFPRVSNASLSMAADRGLA